MPTISSRLSIPLLLVIFVALAIPPTARAATVLPGAEDCAWWNAACRNRNYEAGFNPAGTARRLPSAPTPAPASAPSSVLPVDNVAPTPTRDPAVPSWAANLSAEQFYEKVSLPCREFQGWTCDGEKQRLFYQSGGKSITPTASPYTVQRNEAFEPAATPLPTAGAVEPKDNWDLQGTREPLDNWDLQGKTPTTVAPAARGVSNSNQGLDAQFSKYYVEDPEGYKSGQVIQLRPAPSTNTEPKDNWDLQGTREPLDNWDLQGRAPSTRALTPLEKYQAQFNNSRPTGETYGVTKFTTDGDMARDYCVNKQKTLDANLDVSECTVVELQKLNAGQQLGSAPQPSSGNEAGCATMYPNEGDYGRYLQCVTQGSSQSSSGGSEPNQSPYRDDPATDPYSFMQSCDNRYGANTPDANTCKEPILIEMGISGSAQAQTSEDFYNQLRQNAANATFETRPAPSTAQPCLNRAGNGDCLDEPTGGLRCYSWIASWLPACEDYKSTPTIVPTADGGFRLDRNADSVVDNSRYPVTDSSGQSTNMYTVAQEDTGPGEFVTPGWMTRFKNWFTGDNTEPEQQYRSYVDRDTEYQTLGDGSTVLISTLGDEEYYYDDLGPLPYEPPSQAQYGTFVGPDSYCANEDCSVLINYTDEQPGSYGYDSDVNSATFVPDTVLEPDTVPEPDSTADTGMDPPMWSVKFYDEESDSMIDTAPEGSGGWWNLWNSWDSSETQARPTRQFSTAVPFSGELFNQSLAAGAFGAFLLKNKQKDAPARTAREPFGNGL